MRSLLRFLVRYHQFILFLILEIFALILVGQFNSFQRAKIFKMKHRIQGGLEQRFEKFTQYFHLEQENEDLVHENVRLYNLLPSSYYNPLAKDLIDSSLVQKYVYVEASVISNSTNKQFNFLIIDKGSKQGVAPEMAVVCSRGIVGVVKECSDNYSSVVSVLNKEFFPNAMIQRNGYFGSMAWGGLNYRKSVLKEIPLHVNVQEGDTIITSGHSTVFPKGILIGTVASYENYDGNYYRIEVDLSTDFKNLSHVMVIKNLMREEQIKLQEGLQDD